VILTGTRWTPASSRRTASGTSKSQIYQHRDKAGLVRHGAARTALSQLFRSWADLISEALVRMLQRGRLKPDADPKYLVDGLLAAVQGGYLLAQTAGSAVPMAPASTMDYIVQSNRSVAPPIGPGPGRCSQPGVRVGVRRSERRTPTSSARQHPGTVDSPARRMREAEDAQR
jgi:hypothetical protein